ncbi:MAG: T9SS type A sorting domain-containing protein [Bacteroidota bacterium]
MKKILFSFCLGICFLTGSAQLSWSPVANYFSPVTPTDLTIGPDGSIYCLWYHPQFKSGLVHSTDNGQNWTNLNPNGFSISDFAYDIAFSGNNLLLVSSSLWMSTDNGQNWVAGGSGLTANLDLSSMTVLPDGTVFLTASANSGPIAVPSLFKSTNNGATWVNVTMSGIPTTMEIPVDITNVNGVLIMSLKNLGSTTGSIYYSTNGGVNWTASNSPAAAWQFYEDNCFTKDASGAVYIIGRELAPSGIKLFKSTDNGQTWVSVSNTGLGNIAPSAFLKTSGPFLVGGGGSMDGEMYSSVSVTGINEQQGSTRATAFPNPSSGKFTLSPPNGKEIKRVEVINVNGEIVYSDNDPEKEIDLSRMPSGVYILRLQGDSDFITLQRVLICK